MFPFGPARGTSAGFHQYDRQLRSGEVQAQITALKKYKAEIRSFDARGLSPLATADRDLVLSRILGSLLSLEFIRGWEKNPNVYSSAED